MYRWPWLLSSVSAELTLVQQHMTWRSRAAANYRVGAVS